jgi:formylglycine-generating enzyme required for sulfatase activity
MALLLAFFLMLLAFVLVHFVVMPPVPVPPTATMVRIRGGSFQAGLDANQIKVVSDWIARLPEQIRRLYDGREGRLESYVRKPAQVSIKPFEIDTAEITNQQFVDYLNSQPWTRFQITRSADGDSNLVYLGNNLLIDDYGDLDYNGLAVDLAHQRFRVKTGKEQFPVTAVTHEAAKQYCAWQQRRLPTEDEWEYVASNGGTTRFPWGDNPPDCQQSLFARGQRFKDCKTGAEPSLRAVRSTPGDRSLWGVYDLGGSVAEWVDGSADTADAASCKAGRGVVHGSGWSLDIVPTLAAVRSIACKDYVSADMGFRCARSLDE